MKDEPVILESLAKGAPASADELMPLVYEELRRLAVNKIAREAPGQTLQPTDLVHEAWRRVSGDRQWDSSGHFFAAAVEAMRRILVDKARSKETLNRGNRPERVALDDIPMIVHNSDDELLAVHDALDKLAESEPLIAEVVKLRFFTELTMEETALALNISKSTAKRHWNYARAWLFDAIEQTR
ncbi:MAG: sigma-70 family RNA polymerase sigma factor [Kiritimatiellae bacterium]|nr:sigma-70 family RNA polymerase sigma factor [Kiritimatiellia bacterium]